MSTIIILSALRREITPIRSEFPGELIHEGALEITHHVNGENHVFSAFGGMGTTNIAAAAQTLLTVARYETGASVDALIFTGIAGNLNARLSFGDIALAQTLVYEDTDTAIIAEDPPYLEKFDAAPRLLTVAKDFVRSTGMTEVANNATTPHAAALMYTEQGIRPVDPALDNHSADLSKHRYTVGTIATSNLFSTEPEILTRIINEDHADGEEMEGAAVAHVCAKNGVESLVIRSMSNDCGEAYSELDSREDDLNTSARLAAQVAKGVVLELLGE